MVILHKGAPRSWSASVFLDTPRGIVVVKDPERKSPIWKLPGGKWEPKDGNSPRNCAQRELSEETGLSANGTLQFLGKFDRARRKDNQPIEWFLYFGYCEDLSGLLDRGDGGEEITFIDPLDLSKPDRFLDAHWEGIKHCIKNGRLLKAIKEYNYQRKP